MNKLYCFSASNGVIGKLPTEIAIKSDDLWVPIFGVSDEILLVSDLNYYSTISNNFQHDTVLIPVYNDTHLPFSIIKSDNRMDCTADLVEYIDTTCIIVELNLKFIVEQFGNFDSDIINYSEIELMNILNIRELYNSMDKLTSKMAILLHGVCRQQFNDDET